MKDIKEIENNYLYYIRNINYYPLLDEKEEKRLGKLIRKGDIHARDKLIKSNLRLVIKIAIQYYNYSTNLNLMDLIQEGNIGLIKAVDKFDYRKRTRFSTYASWWIRHYIIRAAIRKEFQINLPNAKWELILKIEKTINDLYKKFNRMPCLTEIEDELGINVNKIKSIIAYIYPIMSLETNIGMDSELVLMDLLSSNNYNPENLTFDKDLIEYEGRILNTLMENEAKVLNYVFGLNNCKKLTLREIAKKIGLSAEAVRQIKLKALDKIKREYTELKDYLTN
ncbi:MAG: RNA polymerase sigma factor RpoD/SigA [bacterium]|nr:RNA polymerase sigma factor RpoD/SigA [bacterium]